MISEPFINVGIMTANEINVTFHGHFTTECGSSCTGPQTFTFADGKIIHDGHGTDMLMFHPQEPDATFDVSGVTIGIGFHWQRDEVQSFQGALKLIASTKGITLINHIEAERYLRSVISSEMRATSSVELLKAHAIISRSWLLAQIDNNRTRHDDVTSSVAEHNGVTDITRWYDHSDHDLFDVCADDHCQRYQGINLADTPAVDHAIRQTAGMVLMYGDELCDARFSKCCGGVLEQFENCWQPDTHPYLSAVRDADTSAIPDLSNESEATEWIMSSPQAYCNTTDRTVLTQVLNSYDMETPDFYRWTVHYHQPELSEIIRTRSGIDFGQILALTPVFRGTSGRITRLKITGTKRTVTVGKELEIRKWLSTSHLYSSAFVVKPGPTDQNGIPQSFTLHGAGWGHGVGLCQIGAALMAHHNHKYDDILMHYYPGSRIKKIY